MKGVPLRIEVGLRDVEKSNIVIARRDTGEKEFLSKIDALDNIPNLLKDIQKKLFSQAKQFMNENTHYINDFDAFKKIIKDGGFVRCGWDGQQKTEKKIKEETKATIRCIPLDEKSEGLKCIYTGTIAKHEVIFAKAY